MGQETAVDRSLARRADALPAKRARKIHALGSQLVERRRFQSGNSRVRLPGRALAREIAKVLDVDEQDIGGLIAGNRSWNSQEVNNKERKNDANWFHGAIFY